MYEDILEDLDGIRIRALRAVVAPDIAAWLRRIFRWYSHEYATPLHQVDDLPIEDILTHWFESQYEQLKPEERHNLAIKLLETPEEKAIREAEEEKTEAELLELAKQDNERYKAKLARAKEALDKLRELGEPVGPRQPRPTAIKRPDPKPNLEPEEVVTVKFEEQSLDLDKEFGPPPKPRKVI